MPTHDDGTNDPAPVVPPLHQRPSEREVLRARVNDLIASLRAEDTIRLQTEARELGALREALDERGMGDAATECELRATVFAMLAALAAGRGDG